MKEQKEPWEVDRDEALKKKVLKYKYPHIGKKAKVKNRSKWEYGFIIVNYV